MTNEQRKIVERIARQHVEKANQQIPLTDQTKGRLFNLFVNAITTGGAELADTIENEAEDLAVLAAGPPTQHGQSIHADVAGVRQIVEIRKNDKAFVSTVLEIIAENNNLASLADAIALMANCTYQHLKNAINHATPGQPFLGEKPKEPGTSVIDDRVIISKIMENRKGDHAFICSILDLAADDNLKKLVDAFAIMRTDAYRIFQHAIAHTAPGRPFFGQDPEKNQPPKPKEPGRDIHHDRESVRKFLEIRRNDQAFISSVLDDIVTVNDRADVTAAVSLMEIKHYRTLAGIFLATAHTRGGHPVLGSQPEPAEKPNLDAAIKNWIDQSPDGNWFLPLLKTAFAVNDDTAVLKLTLELAASKPAFNDAVARLGEFSRNALANAIDRMRNSPSQIAEWLASQGNDRGFNGAAEFLTKSQWDTTKLLNLLADEFRYNHGAELKPAQFLAESIAAMPRKARNTLRTCLDFAELAEAK